ncbi:Serine/threonine-protein phosphatase 2 [Tritonibacter multivorans]|uniref:Serine/threonine-protein phosphatase 2 n=1 Tax=Tritonibacter multivorans TaxID=928856 RepID=A0A0P1GGU5_9RHOB|nr:metallophosphoesterase [Tritonibacter multivorans]MDA7422771.1 metallophosphoesterase [Tritonibacter multivorans]CUH80839.1 Serine/threonine-protein phosphatase 2 [Tritonibacter multivorans]SFD56376.1 serine/threonine protein phosphatase 1 [Tritonibacter multivorans]
MIRSLFQNLRARLAPPLPAPCPGQTIAVVGDIHGRVDLLQAFPDLGHIDQLIFVGDYIDRGDFSAEVLLTLKELPEAICLMGNHEEMMLSFIDDPATYGPRWLRHGGVQTLASFGIGGITDTASPDRLGAARDALVEAMGPALLDWLRALPSFWQTGNVAVTHAGADPSRPMAQQDTAALRWGHPNFEKTRRDDGLWVVHGHTIVPVPTLTPGRINVDTGAYATGRLTAARISDADITFHMFS